VRVRTGTEDPDFPDFTLGGWVGIIQEMQSETPPLYLVEWTDETLEGMHPVYRRRCDREGLDLESTWLSENDLEPDSGGPPTMQQPKALVPIPLDQNDPEDRARAILGLTSDDELPEIDEKSLARFHEILQQRIPFPFVGTDTDLDPVVVLRLLPTNKATLEMGLLVEVSREDGELAEMPLLEVEAVEGTVGERDLMAYFAWMDEKRNADEPHEELLKIPNPLWALVRVVMFGSAFIGATLMAIEDSLRAAQIGAILLGIVGAIAGMFGEKMLRSLYRLPPGLLAGLTVGAVVGAIVGAIGGGLVVAYVGAIPGAIAGSLFAAVRTRFGLDRPGPITCTIRGAYIGGMAFVIWSDVPNASWGALYGALAGLGGCVLGAVILATYLGMVLRPPQRH
jgi:hypothetical protein